MKQGITSWRLAATANLWFAAAYLAAGWLGLALAPPSGQLSPLAPAAGVGIAVLASYGWRLLPGLLAGALALADVRLFPGAAALHPPVTLAIAVLGGAAALQAVVGAAVLRRRVDLALAGGRDVLRFVLFMPLVCCVRSSFGLGGLAALGALPPGASALTWLSWWAADSTGALLAAPLCWVLFGRPRALWRRRRAMVALPLIVSAGSFIAVYHLTLRWELGQQLEGFRLKAQEVGQLMQGALREHERYLAGVARALDARGVIGSRAEFAGIASGYLHQRPELQAMAWLPRVPAAGRAAFERWAGAQYQLPFQILDVLPDGRAVPAAPRDQYFPVVYIEPQGGALLLGRDFLQEPERRAALIRAIGTDKPSATKPVRLRQTGGTPGIHLLQRVGGAAGGPPAGMLDLVIRVDTYVARALERSRFDSFEVEFSDVTSAGAPIRVLDTIPENYHPPDYKVNLGFGGHQLLMRLAPAPQYLTTHAGWQSWSVLSAGLLLAALLGALMLVVSGERAQIQAQVSEATVRLREREARLQAILDHAGDAIVTADQHGTVLTGNGAAAKLFGYAGERLAGLNLAQLLSLPEDDARAALPRLARAELGERELAGVTSDGTPFPLLISVSQVSLAGAPLFVCIMHDLTEQRRAQEHIHRLAHRDVLTGLENRLSLGEHLEQLLAHARRTGGAVALLFLDLDHFKKINDSAGHQAGDLLLVEVAERLRALQREVDIIGRLGGDEFIIAMSGELTPELVTAMALRVVKSLSQPYLLAGKTMHSGASVGIAMFPLDADNAGALLRHADTAMYAAKSQGRGNFQFFSPAMNAATHERLAMETRLRLALGKHEFELYLQPQIALRTGALVGAEALLRWHQPELGTIMPARMIPIAEESGLIIPLGDWVLGEAIGLLASWKASGLGELRLAVNVSARQCHGRDLLPRLDKLLDQSGVAPSRLELELTESAAMHDPESTRALLRQLRVRGINVAIDDFGTGYSSLNYLKLFAIDRIKIDRGFVTDIETDPNDAAIVSATIGLAHALGLAVIAEGVETLAQMRFLEEHLCDEAQGYLFAEPMTAAHFYAFARDALREPAPPALAP